MSIRSTYAFIYEIKYNDQIVGDPTKQHRVSISFLCDDEANIENTLTMKVIASLLTTGPSSPMYKALIASNIGSDYSANTGYDTTSKIGCVSLGVQGVSKENVSKVEQIILETLKCVAKTGFEDSYIDGIIHQVELSLKHV